jgi:hypothetical protein
MYVSERLKRQKIITIHEQRGIASSIMLASFIGDGLPLELTLQTNSTFDAAGGGTVV